MRRCSPPMVACWLLETVLPGPYREAILGDLIEEYAVRSESASRFAASSWFWSQACRSVPPMVWWSLRSGRYLLTMSIAMGAYILMEALERAANWMILKWVSPGDMGHVVLAPIVFLAASAISGCVAARIRRGATIFLALMVAITVAISIDLKVCTIPVPWWYQFGFLTLGPLAVILTPTLLGRLKRPRSVS